MGFARAALQADVPVLPVFTENIRCFTYYNGTFYDLKIGLCALESNRPCSREAFRALPFGHRFFLWLFEKTRLPLRPCFGGFPVKLRTHIGKVILDLDNSRIKHFKLKFRRTNIS